MAFSSRVFQHPAAHEEVFYATCHPGLESVVADELQAPGTGATGVEPGRAGVHFRGATLETGYRANLWLSSAIRVLVRQAEGQLDPRRQGGDELYALFRRAVDWPALLAPGQCFSVEARVAGCTEVRSALLVQMRLRDAICDAMRDAGREKPMPPREGAVAELPLFVTANRDRVTLFRDMSGASLHRRGYRQGAMHAAALNEAAASGVLALAGWPALCQREGAVLADPMCGAGTLLIEAALAAVRAAPGLSRPSWPFEVWPDFDAGAWERLREGARAAKREPPAGLRLLGNDSHAGALAMARRGAEAAGIGHLIELSHGPCSEWRGHLVGDPRRDPVARSRGRSSGGTDDTGRRSGAGVEAKAPEAELEAAWRDLGVFLKGACNEADAFLLCGNPDATRSLHMRCSRRIPLSIGGADVRLLHYVVLPPLPPGTRPPSAKKSLAQPIPGRASEPLDW
ncbi:hypothetical protein WJX81_003042 [Elliptochloris bilobata]|uniref:Uncharacterized protein n=1 Tax=Elliptochloris bilobata TaxID=381761 RepID=A0AAW1QL58_9CHLO